MSEQDQKSSLSESSVFTLRVKRDCQIKVDEGTLKQRKQKAIDTVKDAVPDEFGVSVVFVDLETDKGGVDEGMDWWREMSDNRSIGLDKMGGESDRRIEIEPPRWMLREMRTMAEHTEHDESYPISFRSAANSIGTYLDTQLREAGETTDRRDGGWQCGECGWAGVRAIFDRVSGYVECPSCNAVLDRGVRGVDSESDESDGG